VWLLRSRIGDGQNATKELSEYLRTATAGKWPTIIGKYLVGTITQSDFIKTLKTSAANQDERDGRLCEAYFYIAMRHLLNDDRSDAKIYFQKCLNTGKSNHFEYQSAVAELNRLSNSHSP